MSQTTKLNNGLEIPSVGLGTFQSKDNAVYQAVKDAITCGYRHIDTAMIYFNENEVGKAIKEMIAAGVVTRKDLYVTSKLWLDCTHPEDVEWACRESLKRLGLDYLDLYLIHWPVSLPRINRDERVTSITGVDDSIHYLDTWKAMEKLPGLGIVRSIGVSNFNAEQIDEIMKMPPSIPPAINQIECHPYLFQTDVISKCREHRIVIEAYAPLGSPNNPEGVKSDLLTCELIGQIAATHAVSPAQVLIRFLLQEGIVVLPKSVTPSRVKSNFEVFHYELSQEEMTKIHTLNNGTRFFPATVFQGSAFFPF